MRVQQLFLEQMPTHLLQPLRLDGGNATAKQARGLHQLGGDDPLARLLAQVGTGVREELDATRAQVLAVLPFLQLAADVAQQAREHGHMQLLVAGRLGVQAPFVLGHHRVQLAVDVLPLPHAAHVDEVLAHQLLVLAVGQLVLARGARAGREGFFTPRVVDPLPQL